MHALIDPKSRVQFTLGVLAPALLLRLGLRDAKALYPYRRVLECSMRDL